MDQIFYIDEATKELRVVEAVGYDFSTPGSKTFTLDSASAKSRFQEAAKKGVPASPTGEYPSIIYPQFTTITADKATRNKTRYPSEGHKGSRKEQTGQHSYTKPYPIAIIKDHKSAPECGGHSSTVYGRMIDAKFIKSTESGKAFTTALGEVTHAEAIEELLTGRWLTGSQGSAVYDASCSICGQSIMGGQNEHPHQRGNFYRPSKPTKDSRQPTPDGYTEDDWIQCDPKERGAQEALIDINKWAAREYSGVVIPSDDASLADIPDTATMPGSYFGSQQPGTEAASALWVPMAPSSRVGLTMWGERYIDLISGKERKADSLGFFFGARLHEHYERIVSGEDADILDESNSISESSQIFLMPGYTVQEQDEQSRDGIVETNTTVESETVAFVKEDLGIEGKLSKKQRDDLKSSVFCGPGRSFPANDKDHVQKGLQLLPTFKGPGNKAKIQACLLRQSRKNGWGVDGKKP